MKCLQGTFIIAIAVLGLIAADATAQGTVGGGRGGGGGIPQRIMIKNPFEGVVVSISPTKLSVKGEATLELTISKRQVGRETVHFSVKGATLTRDGKPCELKDVQKGNTATVKFTIKGNDKNIRASIITQEDKLIATQIVFSTKSGDVSDVRTLTPARSAPPAPANVATKSGEVSVAKTSTPAKSAPSAPANVAKFSAVEDHHSDLKQLLNGVQHLARGKYVPGPICVLGGDAFPVIMGKLNDSTYGVVVAASRLGKSRVVVLGHEKLLNPDLGDDNAHLALNAVRWVGPPAGANGAQAPVAVHRRGVLTEYLKSAGVAAQQLDGAGWEKQLQGFSVLCMSGHDLNSEDERAAVENFVRNGGGLVIGTCAWGWRQLNHGKSLLTDFLGNRLLAQAGIVWADGYIRIVDDDSLAATATPTFRLVDASRAVETLLAHDAGKTHLDDSQIAQANAAVQLAARSVPPDDKLFLPKLARSK